jgi:hypothetical protein
MAALLCLGTGEAFAGEDPEPPRFKVTGELAGLFEQLYSKDPFEVSKARSELFRRAQPKHVPMLVRVARRGRHKERWQAMYLLGKFSAKDLLEDHVKRLVVPVLLENMSSQDVALRELAAAMSCRYATHSKELVDRLLELLDDRDCEKGQPPLCDTAMRSLCYASKTDERVLPAVWKRTKKGDPMRHVALVHLGVLGRWDGRAPSKVLPLLATVFADSREDAATREAAGYGLHWMGARARPVYPVILGVLHKPRTKDVKDAAVVRHSCMRLIRQGCQGDGQNEGTPELFTDALPDLVSILENGWPELEDKQNSDLQFRGNALACLEALGPRAKPAVPAMKRLLDNLPKNELIRLHLLRNGLIRALEALDKK